MASRGPRVIAGTCRGRRLIVPRDTAVRPTSDRVKESLFSMLGDGVAGSRFLDLFAGIGSIGIEALSRGAERAVFVESADACLRALRRNLEALGLADRAEVRRGDAVRELAALAGRPSFDIVFADPPYASDLLARLCERLAECPDLVAPGGRVVFEHGEEGRSFPLLNTFSHLADRRYGDKSVTIFRKAG